MSHEENLKGENKSIETFTRPNALFLSAAAQFGHAQLSPLYSWFDSMEVLNLPSYHHRKLVARPLRMERELAVLLSEAGGAHQRWLFDDMPPEPMLEQFKLLLLSVAEIAQVRRPVQFRYGRLLSSS